MEIGLYSNQMIYRRRIDARTQDHQSPASDVIANRNAGRKTSTSSHLSKVETVLSKCLSEIICRRRRTHGIPDNLSRSNYPTLTPLPPLSYRSADSEGSLLRGEVHSQSSSDFGEVSLPRPSPKVRTFAMNVSFYFYERTLSSSSFFSFLR